MSSSFPGNRYSIRLDSGTPTRTVEFSDGTRYIVLESVELNGSNYQGPGEILVQEKGPAPQDERRFTSADAWPFRPQGSYEISLDGDNISSGDTITVNFVTYESVQHVPLLSGRAVSREKFLLDRDGNRIDPAKEWTELVIEQTGIDVVANGPVTVTDGFEEIDRTETVRGFFEGLDGGTFDVQLRWRATESSMVTLDQTILSGVNKDWFVAERKGQWLAVDLINDSGATNVEGIVVTNG